MEVSSNTSTTTPLERENFLKEIIYDTTGVVALERVLESLAAKIGSFFKAERVYLFKYTNSHHLDLSTVIGYTAKGVAPVDLDQLPYINQILTDVDPIKNVQLAFHYKASEAPLEIRGFFDKNDIKAAIVFEIFQRGTPYGRFVLHYRHQLFTKQEVELLQVVLELISNAIFQQDILKNDQLARQKVEEQTNEIKRLIDSVPAFISYVTCDLKYKYYNKTYSDIFGIPEVEIATKKIKDILGEQTFQRSNKMISRVLKGEAVSFENQVTDKKGSVRDLLVKYTPHFSSDGAVLGFFVLGNDVSEIKATERKLEEQKERIHLALESSNQGTWDHNFFTGTIELSERSRMLLNFSNSEEVTYKSFLDKIHPQDLEKVKQFLEFIVMEEDITKTSTVKFRNKNNQWVKASGKLFVDSENRSVHFISVLEDITEYIQHEEYLKKQQQHFYNIFQKAPSLIFVLQTKELIFEYANNALVTQTRLPKIKGRRFADVFPELEEQGFVALLQKSLSTGETISGNEVMAAVVNPEGTLEKSYFNYVFHPKINSKGVANEVVVYANNITAQVKARKSLEAFLSMASHELKTPITAISAYSELIEEEINAGLQENESAGYIVKLKSNLQRLQNLVNELLDVSRIQSGKLEFTFKRFSYASFLNNCVDNLKLVFPNHRLHISIATKNYVYADKERLEQVLNNLISNAVKYAPGEVDIWLEVREEKNKIITVVRDQGIGIPEEKQKNLFQRFVRLESKNYRTAGLGLGLYICKEIIQAHKGEIGVKNDPDKRGTLFYFSLPVAK